MAVTDWNLLYSNMATTPTPTPIERHIIIGADLITLSCTRYRLTNEDRAGNFAPPISSPFETEQITDEDRILADKIKSHFGKKLMVLTLRGTELTAFRKDLSILVNTDYSKNDYSYPDKFMPMAYKLPYFYHYDKELIKIFGGEYRNIKDSNTWPSEKSQLTFINKIRNHLKKDVTFEYWFSDERDNRILLKIDRKNPLLPVFDLIIKEPISVSGTFAYCEREELRFYQARNWQFAI